LLVPTSITQSLIQVEYYDIRNNTLEHINFISVNADLKIPSQSKDFDFSVFPNPSLDYINFQTNELGHDLMIYNISGQIIYQQNVNQHVSMIDLNGLSKGTYLAVYNNQVCKFIVH